MKLIWLLSVLSHDMWIEPSAFFAENGQSLSVRLLVGENLLGDPLPRSSRLIQEFVVEDASGRRAIAGREGMDPAGFLRVANAGPQVIGYYSKPSQVELPAEKFNDYLAQEGLDSIAALRTRRKETGLDAKESFVRCAKSLLNGSADRVLGFPLELVTEKTGDVALLYEKRPLAGALVVAMNRMNPKLKQSARTDKNGRVRLKLGGDGLWMIKAVHMVPAGTEYASYWASVTFEKR